MTEPRLNFYLRCGRDGADELARSMLLDGRDDLPLTHQDVLGVAASPEGFCVIGYADDQPVGYVVGQMQYRERGERALFIHQAVTHGRPQWSLEVYRFLQRVAANLGCTHLALIAPIPQADAIARRFGLQPLGVYMTKRLTEVS